MEFSNVIVMLHLEHSLVWCWRLDTEENRSEIPRTFWNVVLDKDGEDGQTGLVKKW